MSTSPYLLVWDLDGTLGDFYALERHLQPQESISVQVRPGLGEALTLLSTAGFVHTVLTTASWSYAELALRGIGLRDRFAHVEGRGQRNKGDVAGLAQHFGIPTQEIPERILFIGDRVAFDEPDDPRVVLHFEPWAMTRPASQLAELVLQLRRLGQGSLRAGFDRLAERRSWWPWKRRVVPPEGMPVLRPLKPLGEVALLYRQQACPIIGFPTAPNPAVAAEEVVFSPDAVVLPSIPNRTTDPQKTRLADQ